MTNQEAKWILEAEIEKKKKSIGNEKNYMRELTDDRAVLVHIEDLQAAGKPLPPESGYDSYLDWKTQIEKEIKSSENSLSRIETERAELRAFEFFMDNVPQD
ncbi:hypothetical protein [Cetobacterium sp.]|uniref:hypothetical protein n=1 Tax=Cetobacterium sp. TaxID=2071632 RepID=UPI003F40887F